MAEALAVNNVAVITGAASGIGWALAKRCASQRMRVVLADKNAAALSATAAEIRASGAEEQRLKGAFQEGMAPEAVAELVFEAVREERFYILTHPERNWQIRDRMEDILLERNPTGTTTPHSPQNAHQEAEKEESYHGN